MSRKRKNLIITIICIVIAVTAVIVTVVCIKNKEPEPAPTTTSTEPHSVEPYVLLSEIKHEFEEKEIIGRVESEDLGISCDLVFGTSDECLRYGAGIHKTSSLPGCPTPPIIAGHVRTVFKGFKNAEVGKTISVVMPYGTYTYEIEKIEIMEGNDFDFGIMRKPTKTAVFYTCYPFEKVNYVKTKRLFLYCKYVDGPHLLDDINHTIPSYMTTAKAE